MQALLELDCIPAGMELFPASNEEQWSLIKRVIDDCDYYVLIIGGRYGSVDSDGMGYTEKEYRYAVENNKPAIAFLHKEPGKISAALSEQTPDGKEKLKAFRELAQKKMTRYWTNPDDLGSVVSRSMIKLIKQFPAIGWVKADSIADDNSIKEILKLRKENDDLKNQIRVNQIQAPAGSESLSQGTDNVIIQLKFDAQKSPSKIVKSSISATTNWNNLFSAVSPYLTNECTEYIMKNTIVNSIKNGMTDKLKELKQEKEYKSYRRFDISDTEFQKIKIQFKALGLIRQSTKSHSLKDTDNYWTLTEYGDHIMTQLIAINKV